MKLLSRTLITAACAALFGLSVAQAQTVKIANLVELSGTGATAGTMFKSGIELAAKDINAAGRHHGRKVEYTTMDTQTNPGVAKALALKVIDDNVFAVFGPVFSGSVIVSAVETRRAEIPNFTAAAGAGVTQQGNPYIFRTGFSQAMSMPKVARYIAQGLKAKTIAVIYVNNDFGKPGRDAVAKALEPYGVKVVADLSTDPGQVDFSSPVLRAKQADADAVFVYLNEEESARALRELRKQGWTKPIVGDVTLISQKVIELAGDAANGAVGHSEMTADAPVAVDQGAARQVREGIRLHPRPQRHQGLYRPLHAEGGHRESRQVRPRGRRQGDARHDDHRQAGAGRAARRHLRRPG